MSSRAISLAVCGRTAMVLGIALSSHAYAAGCSAHPHDETCPQQQAVARPTGALWLSGGVGDEALAAMRKQSAAYNVHVVFSDRQGAYLANVPFSVSVLKGEKLYSGVSDGPLLYLQLAPGRYELVVEIDSVWQRKIIRIDPHQAPQRISFIGKAS